MAEPMDPAMPPRPLRTCSAGSERPFGFWGMYNEHPAMGAGSFASAVGLGVYGSYFLQKVRKLGLV